MKRLRDARPWIMHRVVIFPSSVGILTNRSFCSPFLPPKVPALDPHAEPHHLKHRCWEVVRPGATSRKHETRNSSLISPASCNPICGLMSIHEVQPHRWFILQVHTSLQLRSAEPMGRNVPYQLLPMVRRLPGYSSESEPEELDVRNDKKRSQDKCIERRQVNLNDFKFQISRQHHLRRLCHCSSTRALYNHVVIILLS